MTVKYFMSSRFTEWPEDGSGQKGALAAALQVVKTYVEKAQGLEDHKLLELLQMVSDLNVGRHQYEQWTHCIGSFMLKMGAEKFFSVLPLKLIEFDLNSLTYAQDSRSWILTLIPKYLKDGNLDFYVRYFMPMILQIDKLRELQKKN